VNNTGTKKGTIMT